jgi:hypothetical protein
MTLYIVDRFSLSMLPRVSTLWLYVRRLGVDEARELISRWVGGVRVLASDDDSARAIENLLGVKASTGFLESSLDPQSDALIVFRGGTPPEILYIVPSSYCY